MILDIFSPLRIQRSPDKFSYLLVFILLCYSGNPFFIFSSNVKFGYIFLTLFLFVFGIIKRRDYSIRYFLYVIPIITILFLDSLKNIEFSISVCVFALIKIYIGTAVIQYVGRRFVYYYIDIIRLIAIISLICFTYNQLFGLIPGRSLNETVSIMLYTQLYTQVEGIHPRNCGMFWEPGAYQGFLNLALLFLIFAKDYPKRKQTAIILIACILSTQSTTGYIVLMFVGYLFISFQSHYNGYQRFFLFLILFAVSYFIYNDLDFLKDKIVDNLSDTDSSQGRVTDYVRYYSILMDNLLLGCGYVDLSSGNGFFYQLMAIGVVGTVYVYSFLLYKWSKQISFKKAIMCIACLILLFQGETFTELPLFAALAFVVFPKSGELSLAKTKYAIN